MSDEVVEVSAGFDSFSAQIALAACEAEGIEVHLISNDDAGGVGISSMQESRIICRSGDYELVKEIVDGII